MADDHRESEPTAAERFAALPRCHGMPTGRGWAVNPEPGPRPVRPEFLAASRPLPPIPYPPSRKGVDHAG